MCSSDLRYIGPYQILARRGEVAYQLSLPENLSAVHDVFHVSQLKKCLRVPEEQLPVEGLEVQEDLTYVEKPVQWKPSGCHHASLCTNIRQEHINGRYLIDH